MLHSPSINFADRFRPSAWTFRTPSIDSRGSLGSPWTERFEQLRTSTKTFRQHASKPLIHSADGLSSHDSSPGLLTYRSANQDVVASRLSSKRRLYLYLEVAHSHDFRQHPVVADAPGPPIVLPKSARIQRTRIGRRRSLTWPRYRPSRTARPGENGKRLLLISHCFFSFSMPARLGCPSSERQASFTPGKACHSLAMPLAL